MPSLYVPYNGGNSKAKQLYTPYNSANAKVKRLYESNGTAWVKIFSGAIEWTYIAYHKTNDVQESGLDNLQGLDTTNYTIYGAPYTGAGGARHEEDYIIFTFAEPLEMASGSTISIWSDNDYPTDIHVYLNGSGTSSYYYGSGEATGSISFTGSLNSVKIYANFNNTSGGKDVRFKATINPAGNNSFLLNNANTADL